MKSEMFIPDGNTIEDFKQRAKVIRNFYRLWKLEHPDQKAFKEMILMECDLVSIGKVKLTVGVHKKSSMKIQYCITAINVSP